MTPPSLDEVVDLGAHRLHDEAYRSQCRSTLDRDGALLLGGFLRAAVVESLVAEAESLQHLAFYSDQTHTVYLETADATLPADDARSREVVSTKGAVTSDQVPGSSALRTVYDATVFRSCLCEFLGEEVLHDEPEPV